MASEDLDGLAGGSRPIRVPVRGAMAKDGPDRPVPPASAAASLALGRSAGACHDLVLRPSWASNPLPGVSGRSIKRRFTAASRPAPFVARCPGRSTARSRCGPPRRRRPRAAPAAPRRDPAAARRPRRRKAASRRARPGARAAGRARRTRRVPPFPVTPPPVGVPVSGPAPGPASAPITGGQTSRSRGRGGSTPGPRRWCWW
jgi:hypothetical protein